MDDRVDRLLSETHHPTTDLQRNMSVDGDIAPDENCSCHHIVQDKGKQIKNHVTGRYSQSLTVIEACTKSHELGIGVNDLSNGVWLPKGMTYVPHWAMKCALPHSCIHTIEYEEYVQDKLELARTEQAGRVTLKNIRTGLENGKLKHILTDCLQNTYDRKMA